MSRPEGAAFVRACPVSDLKEDGAISVVLGGDEIAIVKTEGEVDGYTIECWLHGSCFDLRTGQPTAMPATVPVPVYPVKIEGDDVLVAIEES